MALGRAGVSNQVADRIGSVKDELRKMGRQAFDEEEASPQQEAAMWRKMKMLEPKVFQEVALQAERAAGHVDGEETPCKWHEFVFKHAGK